MERKIKRAIIKMDDKDTLSTGGVVELTYYYYPDREKNPHPKSTLSKIYKPGQAPEGYIDIVCNEKVQEGWIFQDKTNILRDPNS